MPCSKKAKIKQELTMVDNSCTLSHKKCYCNDKLLPCDDVEIITAFFKALSDPSRFNIVYVLLYNKELSVSSIAQHTNMSLSAVSHQLAILRLQKLVKVKKDGVKNIYSLCDDHVRQVIEMAIEHIHE